MGNVINGIGTFHLPESHNTEHNYRVYLKIFDDVSVDNLFISIE